MISIKDVAKKAGVAISTVSKALNDKYGVNEKTRKKVMAAAKELGYSPHGIARGLVSGISGNVAFMIGKFHGSIILNPFYSKVFEGVSQECENRGLHTYFESVTNGEALSVQLPPIVRDRLVDGLIIVNKINEGLISEINERGLPMVFVDYVSEKSKLNSILIDNIKGVRNAVEHLYKLGHRKIGFIVTDDKQGSIKERFEGYKMAMEELGIGFSPRLVASVKGDLTVDAGYAAMNALIADNPELTAVVAANDYMAMGAMRAIDERGIKIPDDISVVGFDDIEWASHAEPPLTTVNVPKEEMGRIAVRELVRLRKEAGTPQQIVVSTELVVRQSTASPRRVVV